MQNLTIRAATADSARAMVAALCEFHCALSEDNGHHELVVTFGDGDREIVRVLSALARYVTEWADGPARIELDGRVYTMHPER